MIIHVKPDKNHTPTYIIEEEKKKPSILRQILNGIITAFKIIILLIVILILIYIYETRGLSRKPLNAPFQETIQTNQPTGKPIGHR